MYDRYQTIKNINNAELASLRQTVIDVFTPLQYIIAFNLQSMRFVFDYFTSSNLSITIAINTNILI